jgi:hypothetical protein
MKTYSRFLTALIILIFSQVSYAQTGESGLSVNVKLFLPTHVKNSLLPTDKLVIYSIADDSSKKPYTKLVARKEKDNVYNFTLSVALHFRLVFAIGGYQYQMSCVDNRNAQANELYNFDILLEKRKFDPAELKYFRPCIMQDDE